MTPDLQIYFHDLPRRQILSVFIPSQQIQSISMTL